jgi:hypothetical protein
MADTGILEGTCYLLLQDYGVYSEELEGAGIAQSV